MKFSISDLVKLIGSALLLVPYLSGQNQVRIEPKAHSVGSIVLPNAETTKSGKAAKAAKFPPSRRSPGLTLDRGSILVLPRLDRSQLLNEDSQGDIQRRTRIGVARPVSVVPSQWGKWVEGEGYAAFAGAIQSEGATGLRLHFTGFHLPAGARLYVYDPARPDDASIYEGDGPNKDGTFWTKPLFSESIVVELDGVQNAKDYFTIDLVSHFYRGLTEKWGTVDYASYCNVDASCHPEWATQGNGVALLVFSILGDTYACSGSLINNATNDFSPLLLTAHHCIDNDSTASSLVSYFFYKTSTCNGAFPAIDTAKTASGGKYLAGISLAEGSDFTLLQLPDELPDGVTFAAWTRDVILPGISVTGIHHPKASFQRIAFGTTAFFDYPSLLGVRWNQGITEPGSSGSPLFNASGQVLGQLYGGYSSCSRPEGPDVYGRFSDSAPLMVNSKGQNYLDVGIPDDDSEPNDTRATATLLAAGTALTDRIIKRNNEDWYRLDVPAFAAGILQVHSDQDIGLIGVEVYRDQEAGQLTPTSSYTAGGDSIVQFNSGDAAGQFYVRVTLNGGARQHYLVYGNHYDFGVPPIMVTSPTVSGIYPDLSLSASFNPKGISTSPSIKYGYFPPGVLPFHGSFLGVEATTYDDDQFHDFTIAADHLVPGYTYLFRAQGFRPSTGQFYFGETYSFRIPGPAITLPSGNLDFGLELIGMPTAYKSFSITSSGDVPLHLVSISTLGPAEQTNDCPEYLEPGRSCTVYARPAASQITEYANFGAVVIKHNAANYSPYYQQFPPFSDAVNQTNSYSVGVLVGGFDIKVNLARLTRPSRDGGPQTAFRAFELQLSTGNYQGPIHIDCHVPGTSENCTVELSVMTATGGMMKLQVQPSNASRRLQISHHRRLAGDDLQQNAIQLVVRGNGFTRVLSVPIH